jgi:phenylalanyl-tRNA synthetase alpha subunit
MSEIAALQSEILAAVAGAADEAALEAVRVAALGKKGSVSALLATMGKLSPDERKVQGPKLNGLKDAVTDAIAARKAQLAMRHWMRGWHRKSSTSPCPPGPKIPAPSIPFRRC